jgi:hypothetical protein
MKSKYKIPTSKCCYAYISKDLKKAIEKHQAELQRKENKDNGRKAQVVTFSYASKDFIGGFKRKWF